MKPRHRFALVLAAALAAIVISGSALLDVGRDLLSAEALDATGVLALPSWVVDLTEHDAIAYPSHATLGTALETLNLSPAASAVQWLKAAAHARSDADVQRSAQGIAAALARDQGDRTFRTICKLREIGNESQIQAVDQSGLPCQLWTPDLVLRADVASDQAMPGATARITARVTSHIDLRGMVDVEIDDADGKKVTQWIFPDQQLSAGQQQTYDITWNIPSDLPPGRYEVKLGVFHPGWTALYGWKRFAATITVTP